MARRTSMFTTERVGILVIIILLLALACMGLAQRCTSGRPSPTLAPDTLLMQSVDSAKVDTTKADASQKPKTKKTKDSKKTKETKDSKETKKTKKMRQKTHSTIKPLVRQHLEERVDTTSPTHLLR